MIGQARQAAKEAARKPSKVLKQPKQKPPRRSSEQLFAQIDDWVDAFQQTDLSQLDDHALWDMVPLWIERGKALRPILVAAGLAGIASTSWSARSANGQESQVKPPYKCRRSQGCIPLR